MKSRFILVLIGALLGFSCQKNHQSSTAKELKASMITTASEEKKAPHEHTEESTGFDPSVAQITKLSDNIYQYFHFMYNSLIVVTEQGVIVIDPAGEERAKAMRIAIRNITDKPVVKVLYSHDHYDHSRGGQLFKDEGAEFISHKNAVELMARDPFKKVVLPDVTFSDKMSLPLDNGATLELLYYGPNDGNAMTVFYFPKEKLLFAVDFHLPRYVNEPFRLVAHNYGGILQTMKRVREELDFQIVVSAHTPTSSPEWFEEDYQFVQALYNATLTGLKAGKTTEQLMKEIKLEEFSHWRGYEKNLPGHIERMSYTIWHGN